MVWALYTESTEEPYEDKSLPITWKLMHDNAPEHTARAVKQWLEEKHITTLDRFEQSPDLNLIENLWRHIETAIKSNSPTV
ncbi:hypothetical protein Trydic_g16503 [Trypoxylus dichotomus]